jgi:hypothetical protein
LFCCKDLSSCKHKFPKDVLKNISPVRNGRSNTITFAIKQQQLAPSKTILESFPSWNLHLTIYILPFKSINLVNLSYWYTEMSETDDYSAFNEVEDGTVLRTLVDWKLFDEANELVNLDALGEGKHLCSVTGFLLKPLSKAVKAKVSENLCTYGVSKDGVEREPTVVQEQLVKETVLVEWDKIKVGDMLDGYW